LHQLDYWNPIEFLILQTNSLNPKIYRKNLDKASTDFVSLITEQNNFLDETNKSKS